MCGDYYFMRKINFPEQPMTRLELTDKLERLYEVKAEELHAIRSSGMSDKDKKVESLFLSLDFVRNKRRLTK